MSRSSAYLDDGYAVIGPAVLREMLDGVYELVLVIARPCFLNVTSRSVMSGITAPFYRGFGRYIGLGLPV